MFFATALLLLESNKEFPQLSVALNEALTVFERLACIEITSLLFYKHTVSFVTTCRLPSSLFDLV